VAVIVSNGPPIAAAKAATSTIPIVFAVGFDPLAYGLVVSLSRPAGNLTGVSILDVEIGPKRLELLHELIPAATVMALLVNPTTPAAQAIAGDVQAAARAHGLELHVLHAAADGDFDAVFTTVAKLRAGALIIGADPFFTSRSRQLGELTVARRIPTIYEFREFAAAGGLISYGTSLADAYRQVGIYTGRILKGEKPSDLPVQQATKVELILNLKTAKALGITVPLTLLGRADEVIE
jgi:putative ABC transport system substrate-binding protein